MIQTFQRTVKLPASPARVFDWHSRVAAFDRLVPPWLRISILERPEALLDDTRLSFRIHQGPLSLRWVARHEEVVEGEKFVDVQEKGPFSYWRHEHLFEPTPDGCLLRDVIRYRLPMGWAGALVAGRRVRADLEAMFAYRHFTTFYDLRLHRRWKRHLCLGMVARPRHPLAGVVWAMLTTGGHHVEELEPGATPPEWWDSLDAVIDLEPDGRPERLARWRGKLMITVGSEKPETFWKRHVHVRPAPLVGGCSCRWLPAHFCQAVSGDDWVSLDDAAASIVFALQTEAVQGEVKVRAGDAPVLQDLGFIFRHRDLAETRARYAGKVRGSQEASPVPPDAATIDEETA